MGLFERSIAFNKLSKSFGKLFDMINQIEYRISLRNTKSSTDIENEIYILSYISRNEIIDSFEKYNWGMNDKIMIPNISHNRINLTLAYQETIGKLFILSNEIGIYKNVNQIFEKDKFYYEIKDIVPTHYK